MKRLILRGEIGESAPLKSGKQQKMRKKQRSGELIFPFPLTPLGIIQKQLENLKVTSADIVDIATVASCQFVILRLCLCWQLLNLILP